jgi:hypothetical protein
VKAIKTKLVMYNTDLLASQKVDKHILEISKYGAQNIADIIKAFADGKTIQKLKENGSCWYDIDILQVDELIEEPDRFIIKGGENTKYRPFNNVEECLFETNKHSPFGLLKESYGEYVPILKYNHNGITAIRGSEEACFIDWKETLEDFTFADGTPFGVLKANNIGNQSIGLLSETSRL